MTPKIEEDGRNSFFIAKDKAKSSDVGASFKLVKEVIGTKEEKNRNSSKRGELFMKHCGTQKLESERLILRRFVIEDFVAMYKNWASDEESHQIFNMACSFK